MTLHSKKPKKINVLDFCPMQLPIGQWEVDQKAIKLTKMNKKQCKQYLKEHPVPYILWKNRKMVIDHHHLIRAAWQVHISTIYGVIVNEYSSLSPTEFFTEMKAKGWFYDKDENEQTITYDQLPCDTRGHVDDKMRSVAWILRKKGFITKSKIPFSEFKWANYLRPYLRCHVDLPIMELYVLAIPLVQLPEAHLFI